MSRARRVTAIVSSILTLLAALLVWAYQPAPAAEPLVPREQEELTEEIPEEFPADEDDRTNALVTDVADGDTFSVRLDDGTEARVRMLGVDTPETVDPRKPVQCFGKEASTFTKSLLEGARVELVPDPLADERDKYGRLLRNVFTADGTDLNAQLIREGFAHAYLSFPLDPARKKELYDLEAQAKAEGRGLWGDTCNTL